MASFLGIETQQLSFTNTSDSFATFGDGKVGGVNGIYLQATANCYVAFDTPATASQGFLLSSSLANPMYIDMRGSSMKQLHCIGSSGSGTLYIIGTRS